jgi:hypothetical protein
MEEAHSSMTRRRHRCTQGQEKVPVGLRTVTGNDRLVRRQRLKGSGHGVVALVFGQTGGVREQHLQALYRAVNSHPHLLESGMDIPGPVPTRDDLHRKAWTLARPQLTQGLATAVHTYHRLRGTDRVIDDTSTAVRAAAEGKVATLLVRESACGWTATGDEPRVVSVGARTDLPRNWKAPSPTPSTPAAEHSSSSTRTYRIPASYWRSGSSDVGRAGRPTCTMSQAARLRTPARRRPLSPQEDVARGAVSR